VVLTLEARLRGQQESGSELVCRHLQSFGVPEGAIVRENRSRSTREEVLLSCEHASRLGLEELLVLTHDYHLDRTRALFAEMPQRTRVMAPTALLRHATELERAAILSGVPDEGAFAAERTPELLFSALAGLLRPLPARLRWGLEVRAGALLRDSGG
jgi:uncharacterized SAM-binding protein YcdF (DUF218 family)